MKIVASNSLTISNVNDGTITHLAYANSADGTDGFTTVYPNLNLLVNSSAKTKAGFFKDFDKVENGYGEVTRKGNNSYAGISMWDGFSIQPGDYKPGDTYTMSMDVMFTSWNFPAGVYLEEFWIGQRYTHNSDGSINSWKRICYIELPKDPSKMLNQWIRITQTSTIPPYEDPSVGTQPVFMTKFSGSGEASFTLRIRKPKQEPGSTATPYMPSESEVKTSDYPSYIGTYSDDKIESSLDYSKYQWAIFKGQNSNAYTAWSWSSDGVDRFSTSYPNLNLLVNSSAKTKDGFFKNFDKVENDYGEVTIKGTNTWVSKDISDGFSIQPRDYKPNDKYTMSMDVMFTSWNFPTGTGVGEFWIGQRYSNSSDGTINSWQRICFIDLPKDPSQMLNQWIRITQTSTIPLYADPAVNTEARFLTRFTGTSEASFTVRVRKPKQEKGSTATPWMPSESESQDQWQDAIPMYVGVGDKDSQNPSDYRWQLNSKYVQASSDSGLSNKAGLDDLASVADTANDALVQAQNAVSNEDYTSWLEHDYQTTINNLQDVSAQNQEDINNVDDRTTIVEGFYGEMKVKWNFIDESFTFSEEGMFISNAQSKMAIQVTSDKIVFWDSNVDVAFITGEVLNIQKGVFLESATIGNHLITKFSDESPVTIIRYVGGIT